MGQLLHAGQACHQVAPALQLGLAGLACTEEHGHQLARVVKRLDRGDNTIGRGLLHHPHAGNHVGAQVQVEAFVQHIDPLRTRRIERLDVAHRPGVDLDAAAAAHKHHDGQAVHRRLVQQARHCLRCGAPGKLAFDQAKALLALHAELFGQAEEQFALPILNQLRKNNISAELFPFGAKMKKQMQYANDKNIPFVVVIGGDEMQSGLLSLKDMESGVQTKVSVDELLQQMAL